MDHEEFRFQPISTEELEYVIKGLDFNKYNLNGSITNIERNMEYFYSLP